MALNKQVRATSRFNREIARNVEVLLMSNKVNSQLLLWDLRCSSIGSRSVKSSSHLCVSTWFEVRKVLVFLNFEWLSAITRFVIVRFHRFDQTKQWARFRSCLPVLVGLVRRSRSKFGRWFCRVSHEWVSDAVGGWLVLIKHLSARLFHYACLQLASQLCQCLFLRKTNPLTFTMFDHVISGFSCTVQMASTL